jgi:hypothetical protein
MRAQSLWANLQSIPDPLFYFQGASPIRPVREVQSKRGLLGFGAGLARSKRDSRPTQRLGGSKQRKVQSEGWSKRSSRSQESKATNIHASRNR